MFHPAAPNNFICQMANAIVAECRPPAVIENFSQSISWPKLLPADLLDNLSDC